MRSPNTSTVPRDRGAPPEARTSDRKLARGLFCVLLALYTATFTGAPENPDSEVEYQTASSLARRGRLDLGGTPEAEALLAATPLGRSGSGFGVAPGGPGREDRFYSWFGVGQAFAAVPFWWAGAAFERLFPRIEEAHRATVIFGVPRSEYFQHLLVGWRNPLLAALTAALVLASARRAGASARSALLAGLSYGLATYAWPQARSTLSDVQATLCLFAGFHALLLARERCEQGRPSLVPLAAAGLCLGWALLTRVAVAPAVAVLGLLGALGVLAGARARPPRDTAAALAALALPFAACAALFVWTNLRRFGAPFETGYGTALSGGPFFSGSPLLGLAGLTISPGKGLLWLAPGVLLAPLGARRARGLALAVLCVVLAVLAPITCMQGWHGAWTYGPRYLLPLLPFAWVLVALGLDRLRATRSGNALGQAVLWSGLATSLPGVLVDYTTHQDLAQQAARLAWPEVAGANDFQRDDDRFLRIQWDWRFAAPWAHWRICVHRAGGGADAFPARELFFLGDPAVLTPGEERRRGLNHLAWVDLARRLGGSPWPPAALVLGLLLAGVGWLRSGLRAAAPPGPQAGAASLR